MTNPNDQAVACGLTKREFMAAQIMASIYANPHGITIGMNKESAAEWAIDGADALIAALNSKASTSHLTATGVQQIEQNISKDGDGAFWSANQTNP